MAITGIPCRRRRLLILAATLLIGGSGLLLLTPPASAAADPQPLKVVATLPMLKEFAEAVGGEHVRVVSLLTGFESEHSYAPKPSDLKAIAQAQVLIEVGMGLEVWMAGLIQSAATPHLQVITTSRGVTEIAESASAHGLHGNPHIWLDPENAKLMVRHIADGFAARDPVHAPAYQANLRRYLERLDQLQQQLQRRVAALPDRRIVTHHPAWPYFARRFGFRIEGEIIRQVGAEPSAAHLARLARHMKTAQIKVIVSEPQLNPKIARALAEESGARLVVLSPLPGTVKGTETYPAMLEYDVEQLVKALQP